jgi:O-antigen ligase
MIAIIVGSRRSIVFYVPLVVLFSLSFLRARNFVFIMLVGLVLSASLLAFLYNSDFSGDSKVENVNQRIERALSVFDSDSDTSGTRLTRWHDAIEILSGSDLFQVAFGLGQRSFYAFPEYVREDGGKDYPHNFILTAFFEGGIIKVLLVFFLIFIYYFLAFKLPRPFSVYFCVFMGLWILTALISGEEFFMSKQIYIPFVLLALFSLCRRDGRI